MTRQFNAAFGRLAIVGALLGLGLGASCSPAGMDSKVVGGTTAGASGQGASSGGTSGKVGGGTGNTGPVLGPIPEAPPGGPCQGLECQVQACLDGATTSITGKVYDPAGKLPLYNVLVYVPNGAVPAFPEGISCDRCAATITNPVTSAITDETGAFRLDKAPSGDSIPLVIQVGKWRRQIVIPTVAPCTETALTDPQVTRLPRSKAEGDIPRIAIAAGGADAMECLPRRLGIADSEFTTKDGDGRIHLYSATDNAGNNGVGDLSIKNFDASLNGGAMLPHSTTLWSSLDTLKKYDIVILSCEGAAFMNEKPMAARQALYDYASQGGRVFASHWSHIWFSNGPPPVPTTGTWNSRGNPIESGTLPATINQTFPKGEALAKWLVNVGASTTLGTLPIDGPRDDIQAVAPTLAREWITLDNPKYPQAQKAVEYMSFNAPIGAPEDQACGRAVFTSMHVSTNIEDRLVQPPGFPKLCDELSTELSGQEKAVAFMLFDLSACVQNDDKPPQVPK